MSYESEQNRLRALFFDKIKPQQVTVSEIYRLWCLLEKCLHERHGQRLEMEMVPPNDKAMGALRRHGWPKRGIKLEVKGPYFDRREAVTFSTSGFVGFCDWASGTNELPFFQGFREWVLTFKAPVA